MLHFDFDECVGVFLQSLLGALAEHGQRIESLNQDERLQAISFDILPWDPYIGIAFRTLNEPIDTDHSADWVHSHFIGEINCRALHPALEFASNAYQAVLKEPGKCQEVAHLLFVAAAVALLDDRVAQLLQSFGVAAAQLL